MYATYWNKKINMIIIKFILRYFKFIVLLTAFSTGWYSGYTYYNVKQLKIDLNESNEVIKNKNKIIVIDEQNLKNRDNEALIIKNQRDDIQTKFDEQKRINANDKEYINKHNAITADLLRRVGAINAKNHKLSKDIASTIRVSTTDKTISAYDYVQWAAGLKAHDNACVVSFNGLQSLYGKQMIIINGFK